jgi:hypothetical protein
LHPAIDFYERALGFGREEPPQARFDRLLHRLEQYDLARPEMVPLSQKKSRWIWRTPVW